MSKNKKKEPKQEAPQPDFAKILIGEIAKYVQSPSPRVYGVLLTFTGKNENGAVAMAGMNARLEFCQEMAPQLPPQRPSVDTTTEIPKTPKPSKGAFRKSGGG